MELFVALLSANSWIVILVFIIMVIIIVVLALVLNKILSNNEVEIDFKNFKISLKHSTNNNFTEKVFETEAEINDHMSDILMKANPAIFTVKMGFTEERQTKETLRAQARKQDLILYLPRMIDFAQELKDLGATVIIYGDDRFTPKSRFTIVRSNQHDAQMYFGYTRSDNKHVLRIFSATNEGPTFHVTNDLLEIIKTYIVPINNSQSSKQ